MCLLCLLYRLLFGGGVVACLFLLCVFGVCVWLFVLFRYSFILGGGVVFVWLMFLFVFCFVLFSGLLFVGVLLCVCVCCDLLFVCLFFFFRFF